MNSLFHTSPLAWRDWGIDLVIGVVAYAVVELDKWRERALTHRHGTTRSA